MKQLFITVLFSTLLNHFTFSQQCGNCKLTPSVALYDVDVQVEKPKLNGTDSTGWLEWLQLFWINKHAQASLFEKNKNCIRFTQPYDSRISGESFVNKDGVEVPSLVGDGDYIKVGLAYTNIPPSGNLSKFGNYITSGYIKKNGTGFVMHLEIQTSCSRKTVISSDVSFQSTASSDQ